MLTRCRGTCPDPIQRGEQHTIKLTIISLYLLLFLVAAGSALAQETPTAAPAGVKLVEAKAVQDLQARARS